MSKDKGKNRVAVTKLLTQPLKKQGFRKKRYLWNRARGDLIDVVELQFGEFTDISSDSFTVNLGVCARSSYEVLYTKVLPDFVQEVQCTIRARLGALMKGGIYSKSVAGKQADHWWKTQQIIETEESGNQFTETLINLGLTFFENFNSLDDIDRFFSDHLLSSSSLPIDYVNAALVKTKLGHSVEATKLLKHVDERFVDWREWANRVRSLLEHSAS